MCPWSLQPLDQRGTHAGVMSVTDSQSRACDYENEIQFHFGFADAAILFRII